MKSAKGDHPIQLNAASVCKKNNNKFIPAAVTGTIASSLRAQLL